ncbi:MAG: hypothetical protein KF861_04865 [Planctomycetaceae bacterium]|nr:hypothetical protein [Planctomycetaceae bacterium]
MLLAAVEQGRFTNSSLAQVTGKSKQNVAKSLRRLIDLNFVRLSEKRGRSVYYEMSAELALLCAGQGERYRAHTRELIDAPRAVAGARKQSRHLVS